MHINDLRTFKAHRIEADKNKSASKTAEADQSTIDYFENAFGGEYSADGSGSTAFTGNSNPLDDYTCGDISNGQVSSDPSADSLDWLASAPPTLNDLLAKDERAVAYLDIAKAKYEKFISDMETLKASYKQALDSGTLGASEIALISKRMELVNAAIGRGNQEIENTKKMEMTLDANYKNELVNGKDLNNDGWIGKPFQAGSYIVQKNDDGTTTLVDPVTKKAIQCPFFDPEYKPMLASENSAVKMVDISDVYGSDNASGEITKDSKGNYVRENGNFDLCMEIDPSKLDKTSGNYLGAAVDIGIPQTIWVKRDPESKRDSFSYIKDGDGSLKMEAYDKWNADGGIHQEVPGNISKYMQVEITEAFLTSHDSGVTDLSGNNLYYHILELRNGMDVVARIRIGGKMEKSAISAKCMNGDYTAASSASIALNGSMRTRPVKIDAGQFISTCRHQIDEGKLIDELGIKKPAASDKTNADMAFMETLGAFTGTSQVAKTFDPTKNEWVDNTETGYNFTDFYTTGISDCYVPESTLPTKEDPLRSFQTGVIMYDVRGAITGSNYNDIIKTLGANEYTKYAEGQIPEDLRNLRPGDAFWNNVVEANGGNSIVVAGKGNNTITNASLVWIDAQGSNNCTNIVQIPSLHSAERGEKGSNPKAYVKIIGGTEAYISNPEEYNSANHANDKPENGEAEYDRWKNSYDDDFFDVTSSQIYSLHDFCEKEWGGRGIPPGKGNQVPDEVMMVSTMVRDAKEKIENELNKEADINSDILEASWENVMAEKTMLDDEMNGFFSKMFGEMSTFEEEASDPTLEL
ncbi:MAG: hypothetical protein GX659_00560 [Myxococcales bacterium]|nr:hypothetical protein [Myxococcales bacterium]